MRLLVATFILMPLLAFCQSMTTPGVGQLPQKFDTIAQLVSRPGTNYQTVLVRGYSSVGDWGAERQARFIPGTGASTNRGCDFATTGGRWHFPDCDSGKINVEWFGAQPYFPATGSESPTNHVASSTAVQAATDYLADNGGGAIYFSPGTYWFDTTVSVKPRVRYVGVSGANALFAIRDGTSGTARAAGISYIECSTAAGAGIAAFKLDGMTDYSGMYTYSFVNLDGDTITYHESGGNSFENLVFTCYRWGWGTGNTTPVAGIVIDQVAGVIVKDCGFVNIAGTGLWAHGAIALHVKGCWFQNCLVDSLFYAYGSDSMFEGNSSGVGSWLIYRANSHVFQGNQIWNPDQSLVNYSGSDSVVTNTEFGFTRRYAVERTITSDSANDTFTSASRIGANSGTLVYFTGTSVPSPFQTNRPYFAIGVSNDIRSIRLATSPKNALAGTYVDVQDTSTNGTWHLTSTDACVWVYESEEIYIRDNRLDQSFRNNVELHKVRKSKVDSNEMWDMGVNMGPSRKNLYMGHDTTFIGVLLDQCDAVKVAENIFVGGYNGESQSLSRPKNPVYGVYAKNSSWCTASGNIFDRVWSGLYSDSNSVGCIAIGNFPTATVERVAQSANTNGMNSSIRYGINFANTNIVRSAEWPAVYTNLTDFTVVVNFSKETAREELPALQSYDPILTLSSTTNLNPGFDQYGFGITYYDADPSIGGSTNKLLLINLQSAINTNYLRTITSILAEEYVRGTPIQLVVTRTGTNWYMKANGIVIAVPFVATGLGTTRDQPIYAKFLTLGYWPRQFRNGWINNVAIYNRGFTSDELYYDRFNQSATNLILSWDFRGVQGNTVDDRSDNNIDGTAVSLNGTTLHTFGEDEGGWINRFQKYNTNLVTISELTGGNSSNFFSGIGIFKQVTTNDIPGLVTTLTTHTHPYLPLAGGAMVGPVTSSSTWQGTSFSGEQFIASGASAGLQLKGRSSTTNLFNLYIADTNLVFYFYPGSGGGYNPFIFRTNGNIVGISGTFWHSGNDGSGSTLDADLLDGSHKSALVLSVDGSPVSSPNLIDATYIHFANAGSDIYATPVNSGVSAGTYSNPSITVDIKGRVTAISSGSAGDEVTINSSATSNPNFKDGSNITFGLSGSDVTADLTATGVAAASYTYAGGSVTVDAKGRVTGASSGLSPYQIVTGYITNGANVTITDTGSKISISATTGGSTNGTPLYVDTAGPLATANLADSTEVNPAASGTNVTFSIVTSSLATNKIDSTFYNLLMAADVDTATNILVNGTLVTFANLQDDTGAGGINFAVSGSNIKAYATNVTHGLTFTNGLTNSANVVQWAVAPGANITLTTNNGQITIAASTGVTNSGTGVSVDSGALLVYANLINSSEVDPSVSGTNVSFAIVNNSLETNRLTTNAFIYLLNRANHLNTQPWTTIDSTPTTLGGYGIVNAQLTNTTLTRLGGIGPGTAGDILYRDATGWTNLAKGTDGDVLTLASGYPNWEPPTVGSSGGYLAKSVTVTMASNTVDEVDLVTWTIPADTLSTDGDELEFHVPAKYRQYTGLTTAYTYEFAIDDDTGGEAYIDGSFAPGTASISSAYQMDWTVRVKRMSSTTAFITLKHVLGADNAGDTTNIVTASRYLEHTLNVGWNDDVVFQLRVSLGTAAADHCIVAYGSTVRKLR